MPGAVGVAGTVTGISFDFHRSEGIMRLQPNVSWTPDRGGFYPVHCGRCNRVIGSVDTLAGRAQVIKKMMALHYCTARDVHIINRAKLIQAQEEANKRNFKAANALLKAAYTP